MNDNFQELRKIFLVMKGIQDIIIIVLKENLNDWNVFQFNNQIRPETKRYDALDFYLKSEASCDNFQ